MGDNSSFQILNISDILPNRFQPRIKFEDESLDELAESINRYGVIEPIVVRPIGNKYEIIAGERRYKASKLASKTTIPSIVINLSDKDSEELALLENVQRQSLNPIEEAVSYKRILDMGYITRDDLSKKIGKPQSVILNKTRLLKLADEVQSYLLNNKISERHARALLNITDLDDQVDMLHRIVNERLTVKKTNKEIRNYLEKNKDDDTETLFDNERGNDEVDIDKIMKEAKDINVESNDSGVAPDLMAAQTTNSSEANSQIFESSPVSAEIPVSQGQNKFVSVQPTIDNSLAGGSTMSSDNQAANNNGAVFDNMFNNPINTQAPIDAASASTNPQPVVSNDPIASIPVQPMPVSSDSNTSINEEISSIVSDALKNQPITNQAFSDGVNSGSSVSFNNIPDFNINSSTDNNVTPINEPLGTPAEALNQSQSGTEQVNVDSSVSISSEVNVPIINEQISNFSNSNASTGDVQASNIDMSTALQGNPSVLEAPQVKVSNPVPNFAKIVQKLRECADEIEKGGNFVNLEEVDLGNQYKVIFTFDK